jgi:tripartite-type tricarboxylate transporter receptor subunit TctC
MLAVALLAASSGAAAAETYPSRPVQVLVPFSAGNVIDLQARAMADPLRDQLGQPVVVVNREGAGGMVAMAALANAKPDGYTILYAPNGQLTLQPHLRKSLPFKPEQIHPVCNVFESHFAIVVRPESPFQSFGDLIAAARQRPGKIAYGLSGIGSIPHLQFHMVAARAAAEFNVVAYRNYGLVVPDLLSGQLDFAVMAFGSFQRPPLKVLAVLSAARNPLFADVPSSTELGFPAETAAFGGLYAHAATPPPVLARIEAACAAAAKAPSYLAFVQRVGADFTYLGSGDFAKRLAADSRDKAEAVKLLKLQVE